MQETCHTIVFDENQEFFTRFMPLHQPMRNDLRELAGDPQLQLTLYKPPSGNRWYLAAVFGNAAKTEIVRKRLAQLLVGMGLHDYMENINVNAKLPPGHRDLPKFG